MEIRCILDEPEDAIKNYINFQMRNKNNDRSTDEKENSFK